MERIQPLPPGRSGDRGGLCLDPVQELVPGGHEGRGTVALQPGRDLAHVHAGLGETSEHGVGVTAVDRQRLCPLMEGLGGRGPPPLLQRRTESHGRDDKSAGTRLSNYAAFPFSQGIGGRPSCRLPHPIGFVKATSTRGGAAGGAAIDGR